MLDVVVTSFVVVVAAVVVDGGVVGGVVDGGVGGGVVGGGVVGGGVVDGGGVGGAAVVDVDEGVVGPISVIQQSLITTKSDYCFNQRKTFKFHHDH